MLVSSKELLQKAKEGNYAIPSPDYFDLDSLRVYANVAEELNCPIILAYAQAHQKVCSLQEAALIGKYIASQVSVPVALHLDHGVDEAFILEAIDLGFTSVMIDASMDSFEDNIRKTKKVVDYAHRRGVSVEAEIGHVGSGENYENHSNSDSVYTEVEDAIAFVEATNVDSLAVSIGTAHGVYKGVPNINFERLEALAKSVDVPLVLHGGSSSGDENLHQCAISGISKINIFTDFLIGAMDEIKKCEPKDYLKLKEDSNNGMKKVLKHYYEVFNMVKHD